MSYINTRTKADLIREKIQEIGGCRTYEEWSKILSVERYSVQNAVYHHPKLKERYIQLTRRRYVWKWPIKKISKKIEEEYKKKGRLNTKDLRKLLGLGREQIHSIISKNPHLRKYYISSTEAKEEEIIQKFRDHWFGSPRFIKDWATLTGLSNGTMRSWNDKINKVFGQEVILEETTVREEEIKNHPQEKTLTEWSKYFDLEISALHHFFTRKNLHHYRKNCPEKYLKEMEKK